MHNDSVVNSVFQYWQTVMNKPRAKMDAKRAKAIMGRLKDGYTQQDLQDAILGCSLSRFHRGENDRRRAYQDIELICRDANHVDSFLDILESEQRKSAHVQRYREGASQPKQINEMALGQLRAIVGGRPA